MVGVFEQPEVVGKFTELGLAVLEHVPGQEEVDAGLGQGERVGRRVAHQLRLQRQGNVPGEELFEAPAAVEVAELSRGLVGGLFSLGTLAKEGTGQVRKASVVGNVFPMLL